MGGYSVNSIDLSPFYLFYLNNGVNLFSTVYGTTKPIMKLSLINTSRNTLVKSSGWTPSSWTSIKLYLKVDFMGERVTVELARGTPHGRDKER